MTKNRKKPPNVGEPYNFSKQEITLNTMGNSSQTKGKGPIKHQKMSISQEVYTEYTELVNLFSDPLYNSVYELALADQLTDLYKDYEASGNADTYEMLCEQIETLQAYFEYKTEIYDYPLFVRKCENFDINFKPTTDIDILAALREHPLAASIEWQLFDEVLYCSFMVRYHKRQEKDMDLAQKARIKAIAHLQSISEYSSSNRSTTSLI